MHKFDQSIRERMAIEAETRRLGEERRARPRVDLDLLTRAVVYLCDKEGCTDAFDSANEAWQEEFPERCRNKFSKEEWALLRGIARLSRGFP